MAATVGRPTDRIEMRVAASVAHLGLILAPLLALTITTGVVPAITLDEPVLAGRPRRRLPPLDSGPGSQRRPSARYIQDGADPGVVGPVAAEPRFSSLGDSIVRCCHMAG